MRTLKLKAPAKINLYLQVLRRRADGYHDIETVFEKIDLCDEIILKQQKQGIRVCCRDKDVPQDEKNIAFRAAQLLLQKASCSLGVQITIKKNIPVAAGLGGGSSDAASVLLGLNRLFRLRQSRLQLLRLGRQVGADVPFFILGTSRARGRGRGDILTKLSAKHKFWYVLAVPSGLLVSTRLMYQQPRITLTKTLRNARIIIRALNEGDITALNKYSYNSFAQILRQKYIQIQEIQKALIAHRAKAALISGSGPSVFCITAARKEAMLISRHLQTEGKNWRIMVAIIYKDKT